jgi:hypothetical protein
VSAGWPFPPDYRASGILLHVTSLPSPYGIGDLGPVAISWIDRLQEAGQNWWQALPIGPTGYGNSPYQPLSSFAGNGLVISPEWLIEDGLFATSGEHPSFPVRLYRTLRNSSQPYRRVSCRTVNRRLVMELASKSP